MTTSVERVVFDCNVYLQALTSPTGPAARLVEFAFNGTVSLFVSAHSLEEVADVASRPYIAAKFRLDPAVVTKFITSVRGVATYLDSVPRVYDFPRDPNDAHYVDLAVAVNARLIVSRDKDLLSLRDTATPEGRDFAARFPELDILTPPEALKLLDPTSLP